jgi:integrase
LTERLVRAARAGGAVTNVWDTRERGLVLKVQPSGHRSFYFQYTHRARRQWYHLGLIPLSDARRIALKLKVAVAEGRDPVAERQAERGADTFAELAKRYLNEHAKRKNRSWQQADRLVRTYLLPKWARLDARSISRADVRAAVNKIAAPVLANQVLAAASAIFSWGVKQDVLPLNPAKGVERNETRSRERVLNDGELPLFWRAFSDAGIRGRILQCILLLGQRPGEVICSRAEHIKEGWWELPGKPDAALRWPGTKNGQTHRVWLPQAARDIMSVQDRGLLFTTSRGNPIAHLDATLRQICDALGVEEKLTPHDLRRTFSTVVTRLGFGREAMNRVTNHKEGGIADVYDRHKYADENKCVMEAVARHVVDLAEGRRDGGTVIRGRF